MQKFKAKLKKVIPLTEDTYDYIFDYEKFNFVPGQFFIMDIEDGKEGKCTRSYSVASKPGEDTFLLNVKLLEEGRGSNYFRSLNIGQEVSFMGPFGHFQLKDSPKDIVMVATGTGIAPFMSMLPLLFEKKFAGKITLFFGVRHEEDLFYTDILKKWEAENPNFKAVITLSQPLPEWQGEKGRVTDHIANLQVDPANTKVYICGNGSMVKDVKAMFEQKGLPKEDIHFELFSAV